MNPSRGRAAQRTRQDAYLAALRTLPDLRIHFGEFVEHPKLKQLVVPPPHGPATALVWVPEESRPRARAICGTESLACQCRKSSTTSTTANFLLAIHVLSLDADGRH